MKNKITINGDEFEEIATKYHYKNNNKFHKIELFIEKRDGNLNYITDKYFKKVEKNPFREIKRFLDLYECQKIDKSNLRHSILEICEEQLKKEKGE